MEIGPIPGIRALPAVKTPPVDPRLSAIFTIGSSSDPGDDTYSGKGRRAAGGQDDETDELEPGSRPESQPPELRHGSGSSIDFFA